MTTARHHTVQVPATSANLGPGFDAFGVALRRHLAVRTVDRASQPERVRTADGSLGGLPTGDDNLIWRSLVAFCEDHGVPVPDVALVTATEIPLERGLGSSSSAIVAGLALARALTQVASSDLDLVTLATRIEGHPDNVAPALLGGLVACAVDDDGELVVRRITPAAALRPLVLVPTHRQATSSARAVLPDRLEAAEVVVQAARAAHVLAGLAGAWPVEPGLAGDRLHEPARIEVMPASGAVLADLRRAGVHAWLSGAGPSVAAAVSSTGASATAVVGDVAQRHGFELVDPGFDLSGALVCPEGGCALSGATFCVQCPRRRV